MENKIFPYIHNTWVTSNPLSRSSAYPAPSALMPSASWGCQPLSMPCRVFLKFPFTDEYLWKLTGVIEPVNTRRRHKPSACNNHLALISSTYEGVAFLKRQPFGSPLRLSMANDERYGSLADAELPSASTVAVALRCRSKTSVYLFLSHIRNQDKRSIVCM